jgi:hypothetical protein
MSDTPRFARLWASRSRAQLQQGGQQQWTQQADDTGRQQQGQQQGAYAQKNPSQQQGGRARSAAQPEPERPLGEQVREVINHFLTPK